MLIGNQKSKMRRMETMTRWTLRNVSGGEGGSPLGPFCLSSCALEHSIAYTRRPCWVDLHNFFLPWRMGGWSYLVSKSAEISHMCVTGGTV